MARDISQETDVPILQQAVRLLEHENRRLVQEIATLTRELADVTKFPRLSGYVMFAA